MNPLKRPVLLAIVILSFSAIAALADPPARVARLSYMSGSVSVQPNGTGDWVQGVLNRPLTTADNIWTDKDSRAELSVGTAILRMNSETSLTLTNVDDNTVQVQLHQGTLNVRLRHLYDGEIYEVDSPNLAFTLQKGGEYRFDVHPDQDQTIVTVWKGQGDATGNGPAVRVEAKQQVQFYGTSLAHNFRGAPGFDGFDDWCRVRDQRQDHSYSARYVAPGVIGYEDLDYYGTWETVSPYGPVWWPSVAVGWAPYRFGHWVWVGPWGWSWVDDAPWGFAPFHYGRWVWYRSHWGWVPGPYYVRPVYAPALVAFFGGPHFGFGVSFGFGGGVGWVPLGFREPFFPYYHVSRGYFHNVNITNAHITNINYFTNNYFRDRDHFVTRVKYANAHVDGAFTAVPRHVFENGRPVGREALHVPPGQFRNANAIARVPVDHTRQSMLGVNAGHPASTPPARTFNRPVVSRAQPPSMPARSMQAHVDSHNLPDRAAAGRPFDNRSQISQRQSVPRPPDRGRSFEGGQHAVQGERGGPAAEAMNRGFDGRNRGFDGDNRHFVPRPPQNRDMGSNNRGGSGPGNTEGSQRPMSGPRASVADAQRLGGRDNNERIGPRSVPRPNEGNVERNGRGPGERQTVAPRENFRQRDNSGGNGSPQTRSSVPRPTGRVMPATESYRNGGYGSDRSGWSRGGGGYSSDRPSGWSRGTGGGYNADRPSASGRQHNYSGGSSGYGSHSAAPQGYRGGHSYNAPSSHAPSHQGGGSPSGRGSGGSRDSGGRSSHGGRGMA